VCVCVSQQQFLKQLTKTSNEHLKNDIKTHHNVSLTYEVPIINNKILSLRFSKSESKCTYWKWPSCYTFKKYFKIICICGGGDVTHAWRRGEVFKGFWLGGPKVRDHWKDLGVCGRTILRWTLGTRDRLGELDSANSG
jgi:hypothetical protein